MEVFEFDKCLLERLEESMVVFCWKEQAIPASQVRNEWACYIELQIEPTGWQALWKIPRVICSELGLRYPTVVLGYVEQVICAELKAIFLVQAVQDEDVHVPERHEVALQDLWPTRYQQCSDLNIEVTADIIDRLRFFYTHVWMPWDNDCDDDEDWVEKHLESRIRLCYDLRKRSMKRALAAHVRLLLLEAHYIQQRREYLELAVSDEDEDDKQETSKKKPEITDLMRLHLRLNKIRSEFEMLERPSLRHIFEQVKFGENKLANNNQWPAIEKQIKNTKINYLVTQPSSLQQHLELLQRAQKYIEADHVVHICPTLQDVLNICEASDSIFLAPGRHTIKFLEYLNNNGRICGLQQDKLSESKTFQNSDIILTSPNDDSILLVIDGNFTLENLWLDCSLVRTGLLLKQGKFTLHNCCITGNGKTSTQTGFNCANGANLILKNCVVENFATGIMLNAGASCMLENTVFKNCVLAIELCSASTNLIFDGNQNSICNSKTGIFVADMMLDKTNAKHVTLEQLAELHSCVEEMPAWIGNCLFKDCKANIFIKNKRELLVEANSLRSILNADEADDVQVMDDSDA